MWSPTSKSTHVTYTDIAVSENANHQLVKDKDSWLRKRFCGWRFGVVACASCAIAVFITNLGIFIYILVRHPGFITSNGVDTYGRVPLYNGSCSKTRSLDAGFHVLINILSTVVLGASNYCMQCLVAPTRAEVDKAHEKKQSLDIGIQSLRNVFKISRKRAALYWMLGASSVPMHLFYNSTVYSATAASEYYVFSANEAFTNPTSSNFSLYGEKYYFSWSWDDSFISQMFNQSRNGTLERLETAECLSVYSQNFQTTRGSVVLVSPNTSTPEFNRGDAALWYESFEKVPSLSYDSCPIEWMCEGNDGDCFDKGPCENRLGEVKAGASPWRPFGKEVLYCLSERVDEHCQLELSIHLALIVLSLNLVKAILMIYIIVGVNESPLMTIGDEIASFLQRPDLTTKEMCLVSKEDIRREKAAWPRIAREFNSVPKRRFAAASISRWVTSIAICLLAIILISVLLIYGMTQIKGRKDIPFFENLGFGAKSPTTFIKGWSLPTQGGQGVVSNVLVANSPQIILSIIYFTYNTLFTSMASASEWSRFSSNRKGLRVSSVPHGSQRGTYFLQLPYRTAIPLLIISTLLHWLVSQSIFLVAVYSYASGEPSGYTDSYGNYLTCGYSPIPMLCVIGLGLGMVVAAVVMGARRLGSGMPVVGSCSVAVSAACHANVDDDGRDTRRGFERVMWGVVVGWNGDGEIGHCSFTDEAVLEPVHGMLYAGMLGNGIGDACSS